jgi:hypothetical protein
MGRILALSLVLFATSRAHAEREIEVGTPRVMRIVAAIQALEIVYSAPWIEHPEILPLSRDQEKKLMAELEKKNRAIIARNPIYLRAGISSGACALDGVTLKGRPVGCDVSVMNEKTRGGFTFISEYGRKRWIDLMENHRAETYVLRRLELAFEFHADTRTELGARLPEMVAQTVQQFQ